MWSIRMATPARRIPSNNKSRKPQPQWLTRVPKMFQFDLHSCIVERFSTVKMRSKFRNQTGTGQCCPQLYWYCMLRIATALMALISVLSTPVVWSACVARCDASAMHQVAVCHAKAHARMGLHVHHMHGAEVVSADSESAFQVSQNQQHLEFNFLSCHTAVCVSMRPARAMRAEVVSQDVTIDPEPSANIFYSSPPHQWRSSSAMLGCPANVSSPGSSSPLRI